MRNHELGLNPSPAQTSMSFPSIGAFNTQDSIGLLRQNQGNSTLNTNNMYSGGFSQNSIGPGSENPGSVTLGTGKRMDLGSGLFSAPRVAPPPLTAVGRGRGRGRGGQGHSGATPASRPSHAKKFEQPPLLDLL